MTTTSLSLKKMAALTSLLIGSLAGMSVPAHASLQLESSVVIIEQSDGEGVMNLQNTSDGPVLLHTEILNVPEDEADLLLVTPPITRVDAKDTQLVRFILKDDSDLKTERFKRATFEGIPQVAPNVLQVSVRQNIPVIIRPKGLAKNNKPWTFLKWRNTAEGLMVENTGPYVVRMAPNVTTLPSASNLSLPKTYILPGEKITLSGDKPTAAIEKLSFQPASVNGYLNGPQEAVVEAL
ncbi:fimbria/pilus chaperone family protein [Herbaspirillum sp. RTI4]|uniref:fimbria/pilus chaperone family protein n=1 Tax=Herbaspirillum sp. RTI4 TaxID=3048640 RepID=UPI002AB5C0C9|nr:fimbria/pilus chaperone family protein [Herbaspirillum sp. RTI4]MDY7577730.1 fimbria/pilus chaperone family protein [Herbaspirillum sp. RTI4]MEA9980842.1 fimbria/pilus chaperone family protein [Herbaspirillum sp. RTI4]